MDDRPQVPQWIYTAQLIFGGVLVFLALFLYYKVVPKGLDSFIPIVILAFGVINLFFGRALFTLPQKQKKRAEMLKKESEAKKAKEQKNKGKKKK